jgi:hypothetical protein
VIGRTGAITTFDHVNKNLIMFGGTNLGPHEGAKNRNLLNDITIFDLRSMEMKSQHVFTELNVKKRVNHCGFMIDDYIFSIGG